jgi:hypothetical protein
MNTTKKITLATVKSFIKKAGDNLHILRCSAFDGMEDGVRSTGNTEFVKATRGTINKDTLGVAGAWFVGGSRNSFTAYNDGQFHGIKVWNCCGTFTLAVPVA